jgi:hypothetical protein
MDLLGRMITDVDLAGNFYAVQARLTAAPAPARLDVHRPRVNVEA